MTYPEWIARFRACVEMRKAGKPVSAICQADRELYRGWAHCISACANGAPLPRKIPYTLDAERDYAAKGFARMVPKIKLFSRISQVAGYWRKKAVGTRGERKDVRGPKVNKPEICDYAQWLARAKAMVELIQAGVRADKLCAADGPMYKRWISTLRDIAVTGDYPDTIPPEDNNVTGERRSKITYEEWRRRLLDAADAMRSGMSATEVQRGHRYIYDNYREVLVAVADGGQVPSTMPCHKYRKPHRYMTVLEWRAEIERLAKLVREDAPIFRGAQQLRAELPPGAKTKDLVFWNKYKSIIYHVAAGGLCPPAVHDNLADGNLFPAEAGNMSAIKDTATPTELQ